MVATSVVVLDYARARSMTTPLGQWIRDRRNALGLTQRELAERAGVTTSLLGAVETGERKWPNRDFRERVARALGTSHLQLLIGAGEVDPVDAEADLASVDPETVELQALLAGLSDEAARDVREYIRFKLSLARESRSPNN